MSDQRQDELYSGDSSYKFVDELIKNKDKTLRIVSPYISNHYTRMLLNMKRRKDIRIITSNISLEYRNSLLKEFLGLGRFKRYMHLIAIFTVAAVFAFWIRFLGIGLLATLFDIITIALFYMAYRRRMEARLRVKIADKKFVHEKLYIGDSAAITGSANLTFNGMHKNIEHIERTNDQRKVSELARHFDELWKST
ncbi:MAG: hypothetical protein KGH60_00760 [Candidatus Micrarchaeota archaeon]|nr:hypothetical protein [Candidatus Micrarchaeota archaeon]